MPALPTFQTRPLTQDRAPIMTSPQCNDILKELGFRYDPGDLYQQTITSLLHAAKIIDLPHNLQIILAQPKNELMIHFPVRMDDNSYLLCKGYRVQHNNLLGPYKGGIRYHADISLDHIKSLAVLMTMKCSLMRLPLGGMAIGEYRSSGMLRPVAGRGRSFNLGLSTKF